MGRACRGHRLPDKRFSPAEIHGTHFGECSGRTVLRMASLPSQAAVPLPGCCWSVFVCLRRMQLNSHLQSIMSAVNNVDPEVGTKTKASGAWKGAGWSQTPGSTKKSTRRHSFLVGCQRRCSDRLTSMEALPDTSLIQSQGTPSHQRFAERATYPLRSKLV